MVCVCVWLPSEKENKRGWQWASCVRVASDSWKFRFLPARLPSCVQNSLDLPETDKLENLFVVSSLVSVVSLTIWIPESGMASALRLGRALEPPNPDMPVGQSTRKHLSTRLIKSNSTISTKTTLQPSACYPKPSAVPRACKARGAPSGILPFPCHHHFHASRIRTLGVATGTVGGTRGPCMSCQHDIKMPCIDANAANGLARQQQQQQQQKQVVAGPRFEQSRRLAAATTTRLQHTTRPHIVTHTHTLDRVSQCLYRQPSRQRRSEETEKNSKVVTSHATARWVSVSSSHLCPPPPLL